MAMIGRKEPAAPPSPERARPRPAPAGTDQDNSRIGRFRGQVQNVFAELRKVTWPTREETRNLTIVVIGITAVVGILLWALDSVLTFLYTLVR